MSKQFEVDFTFLAPQAMTAVVIAETAEEAIEKLTNACKEQLTAFDVIGATELPPEAYLPVPELPQAPPGGNDDDDSDNDDMPEGNAPSTKTIN